MIVAAGSLWQGVQRDHARWRVRVEKVGRCQVEFVCVGGGGTNVKLRRRMVKARFERVYVPIGGKR